MEQNEIKDHSPQRHECYETRRFDNYHDAVMARNIVRDEYLGEEKVAKVVRRGKKDRPAEFYQLRLYRKIEKPVSRKTKEKKDKKHNH